MSALHVALLAALADRRKSILAADALYGATVSLLMSVLDPMGVAVRFVDVCDLAAVEKASKDQAAATARIPRLTLVLNTATR